MNTNTPDNNSQRDEFLLREAVVRTLSGSMPDIDAEWSALRERKSIPTRRRVRRERLWQMLAAACALVAVAMAVVVAFGTAGAADRKLWAAVTAPEGQRCQVTLPDGTRVLLGGGATLRYPSTFSARDRRVRLTGEAFFDVTKDPRYPFTVATQWLTARVLGTQFSIHGTGAEASYVVLFSGKVVVTPARSGAAEVTLRPGEEVRVTPRGAARVAEAAPAPHLAAHEGTFEFGDTPLRSVLTELAAWYHLAIVTDSAEIPDTKVHFSLDLNASPSEAVTLLNLLGVAEITLDGNRLSVTRR